MSTHADLFAARAAHRPEPPYIEPGSTENVAMIIAAALDQLMADARDARLDALYKRLDEAFQQAVEDSKDGI